MTNLNPCGQDHGDEWCSFRQPVKGVTSRRIARNLLMLIGDRVRGRRGTAEQMEELRDELNFRAYLKKQIDAGTPEHFIVRAEQVFEVTFPAQPIPEDGVATEWDEEP